MGSLLAEYEIVTDEASRDFLRQLKKGGKCDGKVVLACQGDLVVLALGPIDHFHVAILERASQTLFSKTFVTSDNPEFAQPLSGVTIQGGRFNIYWPAYRVTLYDASLSFGPFKDGIFVNATEEVVIEKIREIASEI